MSLMSLFFPLECMVILLKQLVKFLFAPDEGPVPLCCSRCDEESMILSGEDEDAPN